MQKETKQAAAVVVGLAALTAASYFVFGPNAKKNRIKIKGWTLRMKGEVLERLEKMKEVTPEVYNRVIDEVSMKYGKLKNISAGELAALATDLKRHWNAISRDMERKEKGGRKRPAAETAKKKVVRKKTPAKKKKMEDDEQVAE